MRTTVFFFVTIAGCVLLNVDPAEACSCAPPPSPCAIAQQSDSIVFVGRPTAATSVNDRGEETVRFTFAVDERIVGDPTSVIEIQTPRDEGLCGFPFQLGTSYLVYAGKSQGEFVTSLCTRTAPVSAARDELIVLKESVRGRVQPRLSGFVARFRLGLDGFYMHGSVTEGVPDIPVTIVGGNNTHNVKTDVEGRFSWAGVPPGTYSIQTRLPATFEPLFDRPVSARVDACIADVDIVVAQVPLSGVVRNADGSLAKGQIMLRVARLDASGAIAFERTTLAFTDPAGRWKFPGLPPGKYRLGINTFDAPSPATPYSTIWYPTVERESDATIIDVRDDGTQSIEIHLPQPLTPRTIVGQVFDANGQVIPRAIVSLYDDDNPHPQTRAVASANSDNAGRFTITGFVGRRYHVKANVLFTRMMSELTAVDPVNANVRVTVAPVR